MSKPWIGKIMTGIVIGLIAMVLMKTPWNYVPGIVFDTRSVLLAISGLFFGALPTSVAMLMAGVVRIYDGGDGMWMGLVFNRFFQAHNLDASGNPGTGLGLTICKGLASLLGGCISLKSAPAKGSTFFLHLPLRHDDSFQSAD